MTNDVLEKLEILNDDGSAQIGLIVQSDFGHPPEYEQEFYRIYLSYETDVNVILEGHPIVLKRKQLLALSPGENFSFEGKPNLLSCAFHHNFFCVRVMRNEVFCDGVVFNRLKGLPIVNLPDREFEIAYNRFRELSYIIRDESVFKPEHAINTLRSMLLQAADCRIRFSNSENPIPMSSPKVSSLVSKFQDLVETHYTKHLEIGAYCELLGVTVATLNRHVKSELGQTAKQIANDRLALEARVALRSGERSIKDVAFDLGFEDPLYFSRFFRKQFGAAPTQYFGGATHKINP
ncbi:MAG: AraC family transcriptional regulator [Lentilitoribacter sp.]